MKIRKKKIHAVENKIGFSDAVEESMRAAPALMQFVFWTGATDVCTLDLFILSSLLSFVFEYATRRLFLIRHGIVLKKAKKRTKRKKKEKEKKRKKKKKKKRTKRKKIDENQYAQ